MNNVNREYTMFGKIIAKQLIDKGKSRSWLANSIGVTAVSVSKYCNGKAVPSTEVLYRISKLLDIRMDILADAIMQEGRKST